MKCFGACFFSIINITAFICLSLIQVKSVISAPIMKEYEQFRGGVSFPDCDDYFDIPKFIAVQREGGLTGLIGQARFDGEEAKSLVLAVNSGCTYYRTKSGIIHKVARFKSGSYFYNGKPIKYLLSPPNLKDSIFLDDKGMKHTIEHLDTTLSQSPKTLISSTNSSGKILDGWYLGDLASEAIIEVRGNQYCFPHVSCHSISELKHVKPGVLLLYKDTYLCSSKFFGINFGINRDSRYGRCTVNGWIWVTR